MVDKVKNPLSKNAGPAFGVKSEGMVSSCVHIFLRHSEKFSFNDGQLIVSWLESESANHFRESGKLIPADIIPFIQRSQVISIDINALTSSKGMRAILKIEDDTEMGIVPIAILDYEHLFWSLLLEEAGLSCIGIASEKITAGESTSITITIKKNIKSTEKKDQCKKCTDSRFLRVQLPDKSDRLVSHNACIYLPESYYKNTMRKYPTIYLLSGLGGNEEVRFRDPKFMRAIEGIQNKYGYEAIFVGVDTHTSYGSIYFSDSESSSFLAQELVNFVDKEFRTISNESGRALFGQSTGAFNAINVTMNNPGVFGTLVALSPDALDIELWLLDSNGNICSEWLAWMRLEDSVGGAGQMLSYARSWSECLSTNINCWPVNLDNGEIDHDILSSWISHSPIRLLESGCYREALRSLNGRLTICISSEDEFRLFEPARSFSRRLNDFSIKHHFIKKIGGHFDVQEFEPLIFEFLEYSSF